ncbi:MAG: aspartate kinase [bacterium]
MSVHMPVESPPETASQSSSPRRPLAPSPDGELRPRSPWVILKFGGTSVSSSACWETIAKVLRNRLGAGLRPLVVCSALSQVSNRLEEAVAEALSGSNPTTLLAGIQAQHADLARELGCPLPAAVGRELEDLAERLEGISLTREASPRLQAEILGVGEILSTHLGAAWLEGQGLTTCWLDARELLRAEEEPTTDPQRQYLSATCARGADPELARELEARPESVLLTQGFLVGAPDGGTALLGRGGSDTSATHLGDRLQADHVEIWTDVAGLFTADPRIVPDAQRLRRLGYDEVIELATRGAKVLHPRSLAPARAARLPIHVRCTRDPGSSGTVIDDEYRIEEPAGLAISSRHGMAVVTMDVEGSWQQVGVIAELAACFARHGLSLDSITSSQTRVTVSLDPMANSLDGETMAALMADLQSCSDPRLISPVSSVSIVGTHLRSVLHDMPALLGELKEQEVYLLAHAANDHSLTFVVDEDRADELVRTLHHDLVRARAGKPVPAMDSAAERTS